MSYLYWFVDILFNVLSFAVFVRVLLSWFPVSPGNPLIQILYDVTEPILGPLRRIIPSVGMIDISPIVALILLQVFQRVLLAALVAY